MTTATSLEAKRTDPWAGTRELDTGPVRDAFAVRMAPVPLVLPQPPQPQPFVGPPLPPPPVAAQSPPSPLVHPLQVIGSWRDEQGPSIFIAVPHGVVSSRVGDIVLDVYRIREIAPQQVLLVHIPSNLDVQLAVPAAAGAPLTFTK